MENTANAADGRDLSEQLVLVLPRVVLRETVQHCLQFFGRFLNTDIVHLKDPDAGRAFEFPGDLNRVEHQYTPGRILQRTLRQYASQSFPYFWWHRALSRHS